MMCRWRWVVAGLAVIGLASPAPATIIHVPLEYATIQSGIDAAVNGDTVLVADGTYGGPGNRDIDFWGKSVLLTSENGPESTIIDCEGTPTNPHRGFHFHNGESASSVVRGFTIKNGCTAYGGGVCCENASAPRLVGNTFLGNVANSGGAIRCAGSSPAIVGNAFIDNTANSGGGGISCLYASPLISDNVIRENAAGWFGAAIECWGYSSPQVLNNSIEANYSRYGAGLYCYDHSSPMIKGNTISGNATYYSGTGIHCKEYSSPTIEDNTITENMAGGGPGGGIYTHENCSPTIVGNIISGNAAPGLFGSGGGVMCDGGSPTISYNVISENLASANGGGFHCTDGAVLAVGNMVKENVADAGGGVWVASSGIVGWNTIEGNAAEHSGGGMRISGSVPPTVVGNRIVNNTGGRGGGICCVSADPSITDNVIANNLASLGHAQGGGIHCWGGSPLIARNTIADNTALLEGGGISCTFSASPIVVNSILWGDTAATGLEVYLEATSSIVITYSDVTEGWLGEGNIDADPMFVLEAGEDYRLLWGSPCIDAAHPDSLDPDGTRSDMGAHFFDQDDYLTLYLTPETTQVSPGGELQVHYTVINRRAEPEEFWVAAGVMTPGGDSLLIMGPDRYVVPAEYTARVPVLHHVPPAAPLGHYHYGSAIGRRPSMFYDWDDFRFTVGEP